MEILTGFFRSKGILHIITERCHLSTDIVLVLARIVVCRIPVYISDKVLWILNNRNHSGTLTYILFNVHYELLIVLQYRLNKCYKIMIHKQISLK